MRKKILMIGVLLCCTLGVFASRFALNVNAEYRLFEGFYTYASPTVFFEKKPTAEKPYSFYAPGLALNVGYSYAIMRNLNGTLHNIHDTMKYNSLYVGLSFLNKFMFSRRDCFMVSAFGDVRLGGPFKITDSASASCGVRLDYKRFITDHLSAGLGILGSYTFAGDYKGFDGGLGVSFMWLL